MSKDDQTGPLDRFREESDITARLSGALAENPIGTLAALELAPLPDEAKKPLYTALASYIGQKIDEASAYTIGSTVKIGKAIEALEVLYNYCLAQGVDGAGYSGKGTKGTKAVPRK